jgi:hypothetical protein
MHGRNEKKIYNFIRKPEGKKPLVISSRRWDDGIRVYFKEIRYGGVE